MKPLTIFLIGAFLLSPVWGARSEIHNGRFYVDGEPFYIRAIGYKPWRPHQKPGVSYVETNRRWTRLDFERIKKAHFNTVRTWDALDPEELAAVKKEGLMVIQGIRLDPKQDFSDPRNQEASLNRVKTVAEQSKDYDNVLGYLLMSDPSPEVILDAGESASMAFFRRLKRAVQAVDPRPVSMDATVSLAFLNLHEFDFVTADLFAFSPKSLNHALGLVGLNRWFVDHFASDRPFLVGATGGYSVSISSFGPTGGAGGFSEYDQGFKDLESMRASVEGHAAGNVLLSWIDNWCAGSDPDKHDDDPWEWTGLLGIPTDSKKEMDGIARRSLQDISAYNELVLVDPKANHSYSREQPITIQAFGADDVTSMEYSVNEGDWKPLETSGHFAFHGSFKLPSTARKRQQLSVHALNNKGETVGRKELSFMAGEFAEDLTVKPLDKKGSSGEIFQAVLFDGFHRPVERRKINYGCFYPVSLRENQGTVVTDASGKVTFVCASLPAENDHYLFVAVGTESPDHMPANDMRIYPLGR